MSKDSCNRVSSPGNGRNGESVSVVKISGAASTENILSNYEKTSSIRGPSPVMPAVSATKTSVISSQPQPNGHNGEFESLFRNFQLIWTDF